MNDIIQILKTKPENIFELLKTLDNSGVLKVIFPELVALKGVDEKNGQRHKDNFLHTLRVVEKTYYATEDIWLRLAAILHDIGKADTKKWIDGIGWSFHGHEFIGSKKIAKIFKRLQLDQEKIDYVKRITRYHGRIKELVKDGVTDSALRRLDKDMCGDLEDLILFCKCDVTTKFKDKEEKIVADTEMIYQEIVRVRKEDEAAAWRPPLNGYQIMEILGIKPGRELGDAMDAMVKAIKENEIEDTYDAAYAFIISLKK
jgi:poly(A) polymerase